MKYSYPFFCHYSNNRYFWFRIKGYGLHIKDVNRHGLMPNERSGLRKRIQIGKWSIRTLTPDSI